MPINAFVVKFVSTLQLFEPDASLEPVHAQRTSIVFSSPLAPRLAFDRIYLFLSKPWAILLLDIEHIFFRVAVAFLLAILLRGPFRLLNRLLQQSFLFLFCCHYRLMQRLNEHLPFSHLRLNQTQAQSHFSLSDRLIAILLLNFLFFRFLNLALFGLVNFSFESYVFLFELDVLVAHIFDSAICRQTF